VTLVKKMVASVMMRNDACQMVRLLMVITVVTLAKTMVTLVVTVTTILLMMQNDAHQMVRLLIAAEKELLLELSKRASLFHQAHLTLFQNALYENLS
jgi:hypothetical protein